MKGRIELLYYCTPTQEDIVYCIIINVRRKVFFLSHKYKVKDILPGQYYVQLNFASLHFYVASSSQEPSKTVGQRLDQETLQ